MSVLYVSFRQVSRFSFQRRKKVGLELFEERALGDL